MTLEEIYEKHSDIGRLIPVGDFLTWVVEKLFGKSKTFRNQPMLHDVFCNFYADFEEEPGYCFASPAWLPSFMRDEHLMGQISGLVLCSKIEFSYEWWGKVYGNFKVKFEEGSGCYYAPPVW